MKTFNDNAGRTWTVSINVDAIKRVKGLLDINLLDVASGESKGNDRGLLGRLSGDPILLCDVLFALCKPEADTRKVSDEEFGRGMAGDAIDHATTALLEELVDFFPQAKRRVLDKALRKLRTLEARVLDVAERKLDSPALDRAVEAALAELPGAVIDEGTALATSNSSSGNSPASSESIPAH